MNNLVVGISHKTAPIAIRERFYLNETQRDLFLTELKVHPEIVEAFVVSTCNRIEVYVHAIDQDFPEENLVQMICRIKKIDYNSGLLGYFYTYRADKMHEHLLRVSAGLDSLVLGESQILGQVKKAFELSKEKKLFQKRFNILSNIALRAGKKARTETNLVYGGSSVSWAAIVQAEKSLKTLENKSVLIIGAGKMSKLAVGQISNKGFRKLYLMNRTQKHAEDLAAAFNGEAHPFCDIKEILAEVDLCVCSSSAPHYILDRETVEKAMELRTKKPLIMIDISMPRNISPEVKKVANLSLFDIDDLKSVVEETMQMRRQAIEEVDNIVNQKVKEYHKKIEKIDQLSLNEILETP